MGSPFSTHNARHFDNSSIRRIGFSARARISSGIVISGDEVEQRVVQLFQRVHLHEPAVRAGAMVGRAGDE